MSIDIIKQQTKDLIDRLKSTTNNIGLGNSGNEYTVIVETFLYKFLNDKFIYEAKRTLPELADAEDVYEALERLPDEEYEEMCDMMLDTIVLKKEHLIPYLAKAFKSCDFKNSIACANKGFSEAYFSMFSSLSTTIIQLFLN